MRRLTRAEVREVDRRAIADYGLPGVVLMENAGRGAVELLLRLGAHGPVTVVTGKGNNGGDGFVMVRHLRNRGLAVDLLLCCHPDQLQGDAAIMYGVLRSAGWEGTIARDWTSTEWQQRLAKADWIVDALLGTGAQGAVRAPLSTAIQAMNIADRPILAVDVPSGLDCDLGTPANDCVVAQHTATFVAEKCGFATPGAATHLGTVHVIDIGVPSVLLDRLLLGS